MYANLRGTVRDTEGKPLEGVAVWNSCTETITYTDSYGEYSFDALPSMSMVWTEVFSEYHSFQTKSEEYEVKELVMDFTLEPVQKHITFDRKHVDFGEGRIVEGAEKEKIEAERAENAKMMEELRELRARMQEQAGITKEDSESPPENNDGTDSDN